MGSGLRCESDTLEAIISHLASSFCHSGLQAVLFNVAKGGLKYLPSSQFEYFFLSHCIVIIEEIIGLDEFQIIISGTRGHLYPVHAHLGRFILLNLG